MPGDNSAHPCLPLPVQLHVHDQVGLIDAVGVAVDVLEPLEFPHRTRRGGYRSQSLAALALISCEGGGGEETRARDAGSAQPSGNERDERTIAGTPARGPEKLTYRRRGRPIRQPRRHDDAPYPPRAHPHHRLLQSRYRRSVPEGPPVRRPGVDGAVYPAPVPSAGGRHDVVDRHGLAGRRGWGRRRFDPGPDVGVLQAGGGGDVDEVLGRARRRRGEGGDGVLGGVGRRDGGEEGRREFTEQDGPPAG
jgi:hypothetical protein